MIDPFHTIGKIRNINRSTRILHANMHDLLKEVMKKGWYLVVSGLFIDWMKFKYLHQA